jgi:predicted secreted Zn-dependent protease
MKRLLAATLVAAMSCAPALSAQLYKSYAYFTVGGTTLESLEQELNKRGPKVASTGMHHPGATEMQFFTKTSFDENAKGCRVSKATVDVKAKIILPRWSARGSADDQVRLVWDTLSADIKRHEESHALIAKKYARELEDALEGLSRAKDCAAIQVKISAATQKVLAAHDREQERFDRIEGKGFEDRILRLLQYRIERSARATD